VGPVGPVRLRQGKRNKSFADAVDSGIDFVRLHTLISASWVTCSSGVCAGLSFPVYMAQVHLPLVCSTVLYLCPAGS